jgi:hypothetical protein
MPALPGLAQGLTESCRIRTISVRRAGAINDDLRPQKDDNTASLLCHRDAVWLQRKCSVRAHTKQRLPIFHNWAGPHVAVRARSGLKQSEMSKLDSSMDSPRAAGGICWGTHAGVVASSGVAMHGCLANLTVGSRHFLYQPYYTGDATGSGCVEVFTRRLSLLTLTTHSSQVSNK